MGVLVALSWAFIALGLLTGLAILIDVVRHPQPMAIMNITWPITGLYFPGIGWWLYDRMGRPDALTGSHTHKPKWQSVFVSVTHCGGGRPGILVHDANRNDNRLCDFLPGELVSGQSRHQTRHVKKYH